MFIPFLCPYWGKEKTEASAFIQQVLEAGYDGVEVNVPADSVFEKALLKNIQHHNLFFVAQLWLPPAIETVDSYIARFQKNLYRLAGFQPAFINSHTGKDFFSFNDNCRILEAAQTISRETGIPIFHETHRGRFSFHAYTLLPYLQRFPDLQLTADFSHWCTVSESLLSDQEEILQKIIPHVRYIHARIGHEQGPQVNNLKAPEWQQHTQTFLHWWDRIITHQETTGTAVLPICAEFGPVPYMPAEPFTQKVFSNQWETNIWIKNVLKERYSNRDKFRMGKKVDGLKS
jgi:sugar phosphate isomerase/epimerase